MSRSDKEKKPDFTPPGWLVQNFELYLDEDRAQRFEQYRWAMIKKYGQSDLRAYYKTLLTTAVDLLLNLPVKEEP